MNQYNITYVRNNKLITFKVKGDSIMRALMNAQEEVELGDEIIKVRYVGEVEEE